jgi:hypothetical protein
MQLIFFIETKKNKIGENETWVIKKRKSAEESF